MLSRRKLNDRIGKLNNLMQRMKLLSSVLLLGSMGMLFAGCGTNPTVAGTPQVLPLVTQANLTTTTQSTELAIDSQKPSLKVGDISEIKNDKTCDDVGEIIVYAETPAYKVWVCADKSNRQVPAFMKVVRKDGSLKIEGKAQLGWREDSFVGMNEKYGYRLRMPSSNEFDLSILSGREFAPVWLHEDIQRYYAINQFKQIKNIEELSQRVDSKLSYKSKSQGFINYIFENKEKLGACVSMYPVKDTPSKLWKIDDTKYFLEFGCRLGTRAIPVNFFLIEELDSGYNFKLLNISTIDRYKDGKPIVGENGYVALRNILSTSASVREDIFNHKEMTLSVYRGQGSCGALSKYKINVNDGKLDLIDYREGGAKECDDFRYAADPILFPNFPLEPAK
jgi:hypothetical protein